MSPAERAGLAANMPRIKARRRLDEVDAGNVSLHPDELYDVALEATGSEQIANAYRVAAIKAQWRPR